jgi:hypothetical protein
MPELHRPDDLQWPGSYHPADISNGYEIKIPAWDAACRHARRRSREDGGIVRQRRFHEPFAITQKG